MTEPRTRLLAAVATALGLIAGGFEAHLAPQVDGWWHGLTGSITLAGAGAALLAAFAVWLLGGAVSVRPFLWLGAGLLPLVPAVVGLGAPLLFFSGYTVALLFAILLGWTSRDPLTRAPAMAPFSVFLISLAVFIFAGRYLPGPAGPQGDEPHYLLIAESLLQDGDVDLKNQFDERAFSKFTSANLEPHTAPRSPKGHLYAIHTPGLSALIAPGYALLGFTGARAMVSAVMAMVVGLLFLVSKSLFGAPTANFVFLLATFASPLPIYANALFPDSVATLSVAATLAALVFMRPGFLGLASAAIATLPWLHPRFLPLALVLAMSLTARGGFSIRRTGVIFVPLLVSLGLLLFHFQTVFGSASLSAAYGPGFSSDVSLARIPRGASALILDRQFGLLLFAPVFLLAVPGTLDLWRRDRMIATVAASVSVLLLAVGGSFSMWWGGASAPARFVIGAVPALLLLCGACWQGAESRPDRRALMGSASGFGLGLLWLACRAPRVLHNRSDGESGLLRLLAPVLDLDRFFPGFVGGTEGVGLAGLWTAILLAAMLRPRLGFLAGALPLVVSLNSSKPLVDPFASSLRALEAWDDHRRTFGGSDAKTAFVLDIPLGASSWIVTPGVRFYSTRFSLPRGDWTLRVESQTESIAGALNVARVSVVGDDEREVPAAGVTIKVGEDLALADFGLERDERRLRLRAEGLQSRASVLSVRLRPRIIAP